MFPSEIRTAEIMHVIMMYRSDGLMRSRPLILSPHYPLSDCCEDCSVDCDSGTRGRDWDDDSGVVGPPLLDSAFRLDSGTPSNSAHTNSAMGSNEPFHAWIRIPINPALIAKMSRTILIIFSALLPTHAVASHWVRGQWGRNGGYEPPPHPGAY